MNTLDNYFTYCGDCEGRVYEDLRKRLSGRLLARLFNEVNSNPQPECTSWIEDAARLICDTTENQ